MGSARTSKMVGVSGMKYNDKIPEAPETKKPLKKGFRDKIVLRKTAIKHGDKK